MVRLIALLGCFAACTCPHAYGGEARPADAVAVGSDTPDARAAQTDDVAEGSRVDLNDPFDDGVRQAGQAPSRAGADGSDARPAGTASPAVAAEARQAAQAVPPAADAIGHDDLPHLRTYTDDEVIAALERAMKGARDAAFFQYERYATLDQTQRQDPELAPYGREILERDDVAGKSPLRVRYRMKFKTDIGEMQAVVERFLHKTEDGLRLDWPSTRAYSERSIAAWKAGTEDALLIRGDLRLVDRFRGPFADLAPTYYAVEIRERYGDRTDRIVAYSRKDSSVGKILYDTLGDGDAHRSTVTISRTTGVDTPVIVAVNSTTWFVGEEPPLASIDAERQRPPARQETEQGYRLADGRIVTDEEVVRHNEKIMARMLRANLGNAARMQELNLDLGAFNSLFPRTIVPAFKAGGPAGEHAAALDAALATLRGNRAALRAINRVLEQQNLGAMWCIVGRQVKTFEEIWDECLVRMMKSAE